MNSNKCQIRIDSLLSKFASNNNNSNPFPDLKDITDKKLGEIQFKSHIIQNGEKPIQVDFGFINVPENRKKNNSKIIQLPLIRLHSTTKIRSKPIFWPGRGLTSGNHFKKELKSLLKEIFWMLNHHDVILIGIRGIDLFIPSSDFNIPQTLKKTLLSSDDFKNLKNTLMKIYKMLRKKRIDLEGYNVLEVIDDIDILRRVLGFQKINIFVSSNYLVTCCIYGFKYSDKINHILMEQPITSENFILMCYGFFGVLEQHYTQ
jgi:hypothetical protein